jgi:flagellar motor switch protein FliM
MTEVLSQGEIDQLLAAINAGDDSTDYIPEKNNRKIRIYDFKRPDKFGKDQIRTFSIIHETFARLFTLHLSDYLKTNVQIRVASVDQLTYEEFIRSIPTPTTLPIINLDPLKGNALIEIDPAVSFAMIDKLFGGSGSAKQQHELTDLERFVMENICIRSFGSLREAWAKILDLRPRLGIIETNPQFVQLVQPTEVVALAALEAKIGEAEGMINLCYPYSSIASIIGKMTTQYWYAGLENKKELPEAGMSDILDKVEIPLTVKLGGRNMPLKEIREIKEGTIFELDTLAGESLNIYAGNELIGRGEVVVIDENFGVRVIETAGQNV